MRILYIVILTSTLCAPWQDPNRIFLTYDSSQLVNTLTGRTTDTLSTLRIATPPDTVCAKTFTSEAALYEWLRHNDADGATVIDVVGLHQYVVSQQQKYKQEMKIVASPDGYDVSLRDDPGVYKRTPPTVHIKP